MNFLDQRLYRGWILWHLVRTVAHEQQLEQLPFLLCKRNVCHSAGLIRRILPACHGFLQAALVQAVGGFQNLLLHLLHVLEQAENRLGRGAEPRPQRSGRHRGDSAFSRQLQRCLKDFLSAEFKLRRHLLPSQKRNKGCATDVFYYIPCLPGCQGRFLFLRAAECRYTIDVRPNE